MFVNRIRIVDSEGRSTIVTRVNGYAAEKLDARLKTVRDRLNSNAPVQPGFRRVRCDYIENFYDVGLVVEFTDEEVPRGV